MSAIFPPPQEWFVKADAKKQRKQLSHKGAGSGPIETREIVPALGQIVKQISSPLDAGEDWALPRVGRLPTLALDRSLDSCKVAHNLPPAGAFSKNEMLKLDG
jgi:hypothetical protein